MGSQGKSWLTVSYLCQQCFSSVSQPNVPVSMSWACYTAKGQKYICCHTDAPVSRSLVSCTACSHAWSREAHPLPSIPAAAIKKWPGQNQTDRFKLQHGSVEQELVTAFRNTACGCLCSLDLSTSVRLCTPWPHGDNNEPRGSLHVAGRQWNKMLVGALDLASQPWEVNNRNGRKVCAKNNAVKGGFWAFRDCFCHWPFSCFWIPRSKYVSSWLRFESLLIPKHTILADEGLGG